MSATNKFTVTAEIEGDTRDEVWRNINDLLCEAHTVNQDYGKYPRSIDKTGRGKIEVWPVDQVRAERAIKSPALLKCKDCKEKKANVTRTTCPFAEEVHREVKRVQLCPSCYKHRAREV